MHGIFWISALPGIFSIFYLDSFPAYISEQQRFSFSNESGIIIFMTFILHFFGLWTSSLIFERSRFFREISDGFSKESFAERKLGIIINGFLAFVPLIIIIFLYVNLAVSDTPPLFQTGYIDRFEYLANTRLWFVLKYLGVVALPAGVLIGFGFYTAKRFYNIYFLLLFLLYTGYLIIIGQKFGGLVLSAFLFFMPSLLIQLQQKGKKRVIKRYSFLFLIGLVAALGLVVYHYSRYNYSQNFGGPLGLLFQRIFVLQGHLFWGIMNHTDFWSSTMNPDFSGLFHAMPEMMRIVSPPAIAESAIARGVNFTFGYFATYIYFLGFWGIVIYYLMALIFGVIGYIVIYAILSKDIYGYFIATCILIWWTGYFGSGDLELIVAYQSIFFYVALLFLILCRSFFGMDNSIHNKAPTNSEY